MAREYDVEAVERKWQERWRDEETYEVDNDDLGRRSTRSALPYPSVRPSGPRAQLHLR